jgi:hypothetical protein
MSIAESKSWFFANEYLDGKPLEYLDRVSKALRSWEDEDDLPSM